MSYQEFAAFEISDLSVAFRANEREINALSDVTLTIPSGQFLCLIGPSGGGKTTLLRCLAGLLMPSAGTVRAHGELVTGPGADRGMVFQQDAIPQWRRVRKNIAYGLELRGVDRVTRDAITDHYLEAVGLQPFANAWPKQLSGGMRKRVAVAAVFANDPRALLMDEPFASVDYFTRSTLHELLLKLWQETVKTIVFVTHDVDEAMMLSDRIVVLSDGRIRFDLPVDFERPRTEALRADADAITMRTELLELLGQKVGGSLA